MRVLLDAHVSGRNVGQPLRERGHDVLALDEQRAFEGLADEEVLALAARERRILVTANVADFPLVLRNSADGGRSHAGVVLVYGIGHGQFGSLLRGLNRLLEQGTQQEDWVDIAVAISRTS